MPELEQLAWVVLFLPLLAGAGITLGGLRRARPSAVVSISAAGIGFGLALACYGGLRDAGAREVSLTWLAVGGIEADLGLRLDRLSLLMMLVVTGVGFAIHVYSWGYIRGDRSVGRYFAGLSLFMFSMLAIVLANNFLMLFIGWELVGVSSYVLIGFWFERPAAAEACKKAFVTNRIGDFGFLVGILLVWANLGSLRFSDLEQKLATDTQALGTWASAAGLLLFCGVLGKSAQFPLHVWLPDAMEGPTPVSALIHAATMVAAGVYLLCRVFFLLAVPGSVALELIAWVGAFTALLAALMAVQQNDIKRILAYSTLSQLGYMVLAVGVSSAARPPAPAMYHLTTHACFKALLFLGAGAVIHALHHEQDIWRMGGLRRRMPVTFWTFLVATLALCGLPPLSGFFSKDAVLAQALHSGLSSRHALFGVAVFVAALTGFYMARLGLVAFAGAPRTQLAEQAHDPPAIMAVPLLGLAVPSALAGFWGLEAAYAHQYAAGSEVHVLSWLAQVREPFTAAPAAAVGGLVAAVLGISGAGLVYWRAAQDPLPGRLGFAARWLRYRFYIDEAYAALNAWTQESLARVADAVDRWVIAGLLVRGTHGTIELVGRMLRLTQTGNVQTHALLFAAGVVVMLGLMITW